MCIFSAVFLLSGCLALTTPPADDAPAMAPTAPIFYAARADAGYSVPEVDVAVFNPDLLRQRVPYQGAEAPGTVVIDTTARQLFLVEPKGRALRYGIAVGREGFGWTGHGTIGNRARWPVWTPPPEMIARDPALAKWADGMPGGPDNPLGARALYIYFGGHDSGYRIHGTNDPKSIGYAASSGCFRMLNQDIIDVYARVPPDAEVIVR